MAEYAILVQSGKSNSSEENRWYHECEANNEAEAEDDAIENAGQDIYCVAVYKRVS